MVDAKKCMRVSLVFLPDTLGLLFACPAFILFLIGFFFRAASGKESKRQGEEYLQISAWLGGASVFCFAVTVALILLKVHPNPCLPEPDSDEEGEALIPPHNPNSSGGNGAFSEAGYDLLKASQI